MFEFQVRMTGGPPNAPVGALAFKVVNTGPGFTVRLEWALATWAPLPQVIVYVYVPGWLSVTGTDPRYDEGRPDQPSPGLPPLAVQGSTLLDQPTDTC